MLETTKIQRWQEVSERIAGTTDSVGCPIDDGIKATVIALNVLGVNTLASCEGHHDHGNAFPWVDIGAPDARPLAKQAYLKQNEVEDARARGASLEERSTLIEVAREARLAVRRLHVVERQKVMYYLDRFYLERSVPYDQHLIINTAEWSGISRLESQGADCQDCLPLAERLCNLGKYQREMQAFAKFLTSWYWNNEEEPYGH